jgi:acetyl-CoA carboxylase biotin carboxylase subunit
MRRCLDEFIIEGVHTTIPLQQQIMNDKNYIEGKFTTAFMNDFKIQ